MNGTESGPTEAERFRHARRFMHAPLEAPMTPLASPAFTASATLKPLGFDPAKLNGLSERLIRSHWENNYGGSVKALAVVKKQLAEALANKDTPPYVYNDLKREHLMRTGSVVLHELYFDNLGGDGKPDTAVRSALGDAFGAYDVWETEFRRIGLGRAGLQRPFPTSRELLAVGSPARAACDHAVAGHGHVRALVPDGLRRGG